jgi:hypothetical protein
MNALGNRSEGQTGGRRGRSRLRVRLKASLTTVSSTSRVVLHDLSLTGARVSAPATIRVGQECVLSWAEHEAFGAVVWVRAGMCGLVFEQMIRPALLIHTRDLQDVEPLLDDYEITRDAARSWVSGTAKS